jgi:acetyl esterase
MKYTWLAAWLACTGIASAANAPDGTGKSLTPPAMLELAVRPRQEFVSEWDRRRDAELAALDSAPSADTRADNALRIQFRHAQGRVMYPFFHWRESNAREIEEDPALAAVIAQLPPIDARLWEIAEVQEFVDSRIHALARSRLRTDADLSRGDARWLRAKLRSLDEVLPDERLWMRKATDIIAKHLDDDGAAGIEEAVELWRTRSPPTESVKKIDQAIAADRAHAAGVARFVYREAGGVPLHLYLLRPEQPRARPVPVMLWLHGGSATEGTWWHSPVTMRVLLEAGVAVIGVELTTGNRFDRDADQVSDAGAAFEYVRSHAKDLGVDPRRIGIAGFSSGASLALLLATRGAAPSGADAKTARRSARPAAVIVSGACADPLSESSDGYFRKSVAEGRDPSDLSPYAQVRAGSPPVLAVHGTADEFCAHQDMSKFALRYRTAGNEITLVSVDGASHFFGFFHEKGQRLQREAIRAALERWDW